MNDHPTHDRPAPDAEPPSFESSLESLAAIVAQLESGSLGLSESIAAYERGVTLLRRLHEELASVEARVEMLVRVDDEGRPVFAPFGDQEAGAEEAADSPQSARSTGARSQPSRAASRGRVRRLPGMDDVAADS